MRTGDKVEFRFPTEIFATLDGSSTDSTPEEPSFRCQAAESIRAGEKVGWYSHEALAPTGGTRRNHEQTILG